MSNTDKALKALEALLSFTANGLVSAQRYMLLIQMARREGREITDEELANMRSTSIAMTAEMRAEAEKAFGNVDT